MASEYELLRQKNLENNKKVLAELGLLKPYQEIITKKYKVKKLPKQHVHPYKKSSQVCVKNDIDTEQLSVSDKTDSSQTSLRRSFRLRIKPAKYNPEIYDDDEIQEFYENNVQKKTRLIFPKFRFNVFGAIPGVEIGTVFESRLECSWVGIHRPTVAGIHGNEQQGCYSLALSGGYEDDVDLGDRFTYTGSGGRDLKGTKSNPKNLRTAPQSKDQTLSRGNLALTRNVEKRLPVRVIRGYKLKSPYAPEHGYRYDGLYYVQRYWLTIGLSGFKVYKFALQRCENQALAPWDVDNEEVTQTFNASSREEFENKPDSENNSSNDSS